jgi:hypothetical protein
MKYLDTTIKIFLIIALLTICQESYSQPDKRDSLAISLMKAVKITDSLNSPLPDSIRHVTIKHFKKLGLDPSEYFTTKDFSIEKTNTLGESKDYKIQSRNDFKNLDNLDISKDTRIIAYVQNVKKIENKWVIEYFRVGALVDRCFRKPLDLGVYELIDAYGEKGDDIWVVYNSAFTEILEIENLE